MNVVEGLVSTVIPVHNRSALLREAVESVLAQDHRPIEIVIVDDGSTDDTGAVADSFVARDPEIVSVLHQANAGPGAAREAGRRLVRGEFVQYLDSDDLLLPGKFTLQVAALRANPGCDVASGKTRYRKAGCPSEAAPLKRTGEPIAAMFPSFLRSRWWSTSTPLFRRTAVERAGPWEPLWNEEDWEYDCRVASLGGRVCWIDAWVSETRDVDEGRLSRAGRTPRALASRARAHELIHAHAARAGLTPAAPEMRHFSRECFLLARQCGAAGLAAEAKRLFRVAREAAGPARARKLDFLLYRALTAALGWRASGRIACGLDRLRSGAGEARR